MNFLLTTYSHHWFDVDGVSGDKRQAHVTTAKSRLRSNTSYSIESLLNDFPSPEGMNPVFIRDDPKQLRKVKITHEVGLASNYGSMFQCYKFTYIVLIILWTQLTYWILVLYGKNEI